MKLTKPLLRAAALLPLALLTTALSAAENHGSASASISNLRVQLVDLDLNDGISPYLSYRENTALPFDPESLAYIKYQPPGSGVGGPSSYSESAFGAESTALELNSPAGRVSASATFSGTSLDNLKLGASSRLDDVSGLHNGLDTAAGFYPLYFYLSPNTSLSITFDMSVQSAMEGGFLNAGQHNFALSMAEFSLRGSEGGPQNAQSFRMQHTAYPAGSTFPGGAPGTRTFTALINGAAVEQTVYLEARASAFVNLAGERYVPAPVPEPETWAMMLGGLGMLGAMSYRRRAAAVKSAQ